MNAFGLLRKKEGYTQETVAEELGTERSTVAKWETGRSFPRAELLPRIAAMYRCTVDDLLNVDKGEE